MRRNFLENFVYFIVNNQKKELAGSNSLINKILRVIKRVICQQQMYEIINSFITPELRYKCFQVIYRTVHY